ncbi:MAG: hypothetical protein ABI577_14140 [bacterium]
MRYVALLFPRLGIQVARRVHPELAGHPFALVAGQGDSGLLSAVSVEATAHGVEPGMTCLQAGQRSAGIAMEADNAGQCLAALEAAVTILRGRATTNVAIVSRNEIVVSLEDLDSQFADEGAAALAFAGLLRNRTGFDVRVAVASTVREARCAAKTARRFPVICTPDELAGPEALPQYEPLAASFRWEAPAGSEVVKARVRRMLVMLEGMASECAQSFREVRIELEHGPYRRAIALRPAAPIHSAREAMDLVQAKLDASALEGATSIRVVLDGAGPSVEVLPWRAPVAQLHQVSGPAVPIQRRLLRAS